MLAKTLTATACLSATLTLAGCAIGPKETWTDLGPGAFATRRGMIACYVDANFIDGERTQGVLCATPTSGFLEHGEPEVSAGVGYSPIIHIPFSSTLNGTEVPVDDKRGELRCTAMKPTADKATSQSFCTFTLNGQKLVSAKIFFSGM